MDVLASKDTLTDGFSKLALSDTFASPKQTFPIRYFKKTKCSQENLREKIEEVATYVSDVYTTFIKFENKERKTLREHMSMSDSRNAIPSESECTQFQANLKKRIKDNFIEKKETWIHLSTDGVPEGTLNEICQSTFSKNVRRELDSIFPDTSVTIIRLEKDQLSLSIIFSLGDGQKFCKLTS